MAIGIIFLGLAVGYTLKIIIDKISLKVSTEQPAKWKRLNYLAVVICTVFFTISYYKFGMGLKLLEALLFDSILIITAFVDLKHRIIPDKLVLITFMAGLIFTFLGGGSFFNALAGMLLGGGLLFLLALIPDAIGGGDIKFMFAAGIFLGAYKVLISLFVTFLAAALVSIFLLLFRIKGRKDQIPFGPFLAVGSFIAFHFITNLK